MYLTYYFPKGEQRSITTNIFSTGHLAKGRRDNCALPSVDIYYKEINKELIFECSTVVEKYKKVNLQVQSGFFGYDIIIEKNLL